MLIALRSCIAIYKILKWTFMRKQTNSFKHYIKILLLLLTSKYKDIFEISKVKYLLNL